MGGLDLVMRWEFLGDRAEIWVPDQSQGWGIEGLVATSET